ncbi:hypothetical protein [Algirhabdus cladophorae]|uniref:hypothetical protein n=1 Tax=Algirhabdus cladophorae TaxID=3377108 RepID=UPI003B84B514
MTRFQFAAAFCCAIALPVAAQDQPDTVWMIVQHDVAAYSPWREVFDSGLSTRQSAGELQFEILTKPGAPVAIMAIFEWTDADAALAFANDPAVRNAMQAGGVISKPVITLHDTDPRFWTDLNKPVTPIDLAADDGG